MECITFRMRGHEEASGTKYVPKELFELWEKKDPVKNYEQYLIAENILTEVQIAAIRNETKDYIEAELKIAGEAQPTVVILGSQYVPGRTPWPSGKPHARPTIFCANV